MCEGESEIFGVRELSEEHKRQQAESAAYARELLARTDKEEPFKLLEEWIAYEKREHSLIEMKFTLGSDFDNQPKRPLSRKEENDIALEALSMLAYEG